ncbi:hypothetical protein ACFV80_37990 [Streptomyces sp. NPDC059862]|uniref:hypothetical protein n=1 Tax=Streptomyces sp. NPDC059862 TaxID=3346975 RepID=UPI003669005F
MHELRQNDPSGAAVRRQTENELLFAVLGRFRAVDAGHGVTVVDVGIGLVEQPLDAVHRVHHASGEPRDIGQPGAVLVGGRPADVLAVPDTGPVVVVLSRTISSFSTARSSSHEVATSPA